MKLETETETNVKQAVPFFAVSNIEESVRYYVNGLGFEMTNKWIDEGKLRWCWLQHGGCRTDAAGDPEGRTRFLGSTGNRGRGHIDLFHLQGRTVDLPSGNLTRD